MDIRAFGDHIVVKPVEAPIRMGGIELAEEAREAMMKRPIGEVLSVGPGAADAVVGGMDIKPGSVIAYRQEGMAWVHGLDGKIRVLIRAADVVGLVERDEMKDDKHYRDLEARDAKLQGERKKPGLVIAGAGGVGIGRNSVE